MASQTLLSPQELQELKDLCLDPFAELGSMRGPEHLKCNVPHVVTARRTIIFEFPTASAALKWNRLQETTILRNGHLVTAALAIALASLTRDPRLGAAVGIGTSITKDEVQARVWYPRMSVAWKLTRQIDLTYQQFPVKRFEVRVTDVVSDERGHERGRHTYSTTRMFVDEPTGIPEHVVRRLLGLPRRVVKIFG